MAEESHGVDNVETISKTGLARIWRNARPQQEIERAGENWCIVLWSPTFSKEDGQRRRRRIFVSLGRKGMDTTER